MKQPEIHLLYEYNYWANDQILAAASRVSEAQFVAPVAFPFHSLRGTLVHTLDAEASWRELLQHANLQFEALKEQDFPTTAAVAARWKIEETAMRAYVDSLDDNAVEGLVRYTTDEGLHRERVLWHCLYHVVNHGTQHRSECAAMLTDYGQSPGELDFTVFMNQHT